MSEKPLPLSDERRNEMVSGVYKLAFYLTNKKYPELDKSTRDDLAQDALMHLLQVTDRFIEGLTIPFRTWAGIVMLRHMKTCLHREVKITKKHQTLLGPSVDTSDEADFFDKTPSCPSNVEEMINNEAVQESAAWARVVIQEMQPEYKEVLESTAEGKSFRTLSKEKNVSYEGVAYSYRQAVLAFVELAKRYDADKLEEVCQTWVGQSIEGLALVRADIKHYVRILGYPNVDKEAVKQRLLKQHLSFSESQYETALQKVETSRKGKVQLDGF